MDQVLSWTVASISLACGILGWMIALKKLSPSFYIALGSMLLSDGVLLMVRFFLYGQANAPMPLLLSVCFLVMAIVSILEFLRHRRRIHSTVD